MAGVDREQRELLIREYFDINEGLHKKRPLNQEAFNRAVAVINELWVPGGKLDFAEPVYMLADAVIEQKLILTVDEDAADNFAQLRKKTMSFLELELDSAGGSDCIGMQKDEESSDFDIRVAEMRLNHFDWVSNSLMEDLRPAEVPAS